MKLCLSSAVMAARETSDVNIETQPQSTSHTRRRKKKSRYIKQGYHKSQRDDARRVAARAFLSGITLDNHLISDPSSPLLQEINAVPYSPSRPLSSASRYSNTVVLNDEAKVPGPASSTRIEMLHEIALDSLPYPIEHHSPQKMTPIIKPGHNFDSSFNPLLGRSNSVFETGQAATSPAYDKRQAYHAIPHSRSAGSVEGYINLQFCGNSMIHKPEFLIDKRLVLTTKEGAPFLLYSILAYRKDEVFKLNPPNRVRVSSETTLLELDLDVELGTSNEEVSLATILSPLWFTDSSQSDYELTPVLSRKQSTKRSGESDKRSITQKPSQFHMKSHVTAAVGSVYPWQFFRDNHTPVNVIWKYHPSCLDNYEFFVGHSISTLTPQGYMVSIIQYAKASEIKKGINEQFSETFPHIKLSLSKLRKIKREMHKIVLECDVDLAVLAYAYVYFEKLVLMGKVNKPNRKIVAGACLLLAAKFFSDMKRPELSVLVEEMCDTFRMSSKDLVLYEFPVLVALQFSLLTPKSQAQAYYDRLRDKAE